MERTYIALLRGINVSGTNKLPMMQLKAIAEGLGLDHCHTYIQSGNLVFKADDVGGLEARLAAAIEIECGFRPPVILRSLAQWKEIIAHCPFMAEAGDAPASVHVYLLGETPQQKHLDDLTSRNFGTDRWQVGEGAVYLHLPDGVGRSKLANSIERILKVPMTGRNWQTMQAIEALGENA
ncbi:DUF1697 domain-containing protein [Rhizobium sp. L1K21]|uniref:DUF1697 domain-containing protein n=1 Tax=Rhizobium sp. L1K21 TaxID=2954933 RepID=UPI002092A2FE|nr:DUF1697 domain-containing protein [Rhizobium sp. L1K21]MCO6185545.1 DUF1697 domain-containing protein [Rhizobium sp. L1K21]